MSENKDLIEQIQTDLCTIIHKIADIQLNPDDFTVVRPERPEFGDLSINVAMVTYGKLSLEMRQIIKSPREWAQKLIKKCERFELAKRCFERMEVAGPGYINVFLNIEQKLSILSKVLAIDNQNFEYRYQPVIVEFSSPNIAKSFTVGHLRSTIIGAAVANLLENAGVKVIRDNHLGDWGTQFAKQAVAIEKWGKWEELEASEDPIKEMVELYVKFHQEVENNPELEDEARRVFVKMEQGDEKYLAMWQKIVDISMKEFERIYKELGVYFDENDGKGYGESFVRDATEAVVEELQEKKMLEESEGARVVKFGESEKLPPFLILKKDGSTLYQTRDLAMDRWRREKYGARVQIINEVGREQSLYFKQLYRVEERLGWYQAGQRVHVAHGLYRFKDRKMSTRKGDVIWLTDIIDEAKKRVKKMTEKELSEGDIEKIAIGAIKWNDLSREAIKDIEFDLDTMITLRGNSGPYMQYTARRARSILEKIKWNYLKVDHEKYPKYRGNLADCIQNLNKDDLEEDEWRLIEILSQETEVYAKAVEKLAPNILAAYLYEVAARFNNYYTKKQIADNRTRVVLTACAETILARGLATLGIAIPDQM